MAQTLVLPDVQFPEKLQCLFRPHRYKVLYGGRGGAKSWGIARALLLIGVQRPIRVLCAREFQKSIADSVLKLLKDQISVLGLEWCYEVQVNKIIGRPGTPAFGTEFAFIGLKTNVSSVKSFEGVDICWVEEAANVSKDSWELLIPTIRKEGAEIWVSFNPEDEEDYTYKEFVLKRRPDSIVVKINYRDNPWFPETLRAEMLSDRSADRAKYLHVWEGMCKIKLDGVVYGDAIADMLEEGRFTDVPWERSRPVDVVLDLGRADKTSVWFYQTVGFETRVLDFMEDNRKDLQHYIKAIKNTPYVIGTIWLPHDAKAKLLGSKLTIEEQMKAAFGPKNVRIVPKFSVADGLAAARAMFPNVWMDQTKCRVGFDHLKRYSYALIPGRNTFSDYPLHDEHSHAADAWRYMAFALSYGKISDQAAERKRKLQDKLAQAVGGLRNGLGWMG